MATIYCNLMEQKNATKRDTKRGAVPERIVAFLEERNGSAPAKIIEKGVRGNGKKIYAALRALLEDGVITKQGCGHKADPTTYHLNKSGDNAALVASPVSHEAAKSNRTDAVIVQEKGGEEAGQKDVTALRTFKKDKVRSISLSKEDLDEVVELFRLVNCWQNKKSTENRELP